MFAKELRADGQRATPVAFIGVVRARPGGRAVIRGTFGCIGEFSLVATVSKVSICLTSKAVIERCPNDDAMTYFQSGACAGGHFGPPTPSVKFPVDATRFERFPVKQNLCRLLESSLSQQKSDCIPFSRRQVLASAKLTLVLTLAMEMES
jgi:hypothetical protein